MLCVRRVEPLIIKDGSIKYLDMPVWRTLSSPWHDRHRSDRPPGVEGCHTPGHGTVYRGHTAGHNLPTMTRPTSHRLCPAQQLKHILKIIIIVGSYIAHIQKITK